MSNFITNEEKAVGGSRTVSLERVYNLPLFEAYLAID